MKFKKLIISIITALLFISISVFAQVNKVKAPIGNWAIEKTHPTGAIIKVQMEIRDDNTFNGVVLVNDAVNWSYGGIWKLNGNEFTYIYKESSKPIPENYEDVDVVLSVDGNNYTYKSKLSGEVRTYKRAS